MRVLIVTSGSMGDVAPYTGLAVRIREAGHSVTLATHEPFRPMIERLGLAFTPIPGDLRTTLEQAVDGGGPRALARMYALARPLIAQLAAGLLAAVEQHRPDALLLSTLVAPLGYQVAEAFGIRRASVFLQPIHPSREFGPVLTGGRSFGPLGNLAAGALTFRAVESLYAPTIRNLRRQLSLPAQSLQALRHHQEFQEPTFHGISPAVVPHPADWHPSLQMTGYWWPAPTPPGADARLEAFLAGGKPVFIGFGSMAPGRGAELAEIVVTAVRRAGVRAVLQAGWSGLAAADSDDLLSIGEVPHERLFPRVAAVVHHCGAGTTAAGLRAGIPAIAVPRLADQPFWARRLHRLGAAPPPIPLKAEALTAALREVTTNPHYAARAQALGARIRTEDGTAPILDWLG
ncbi:UDP:flavonoid glycosyltransferase YjiC (YdhE family) [Actinoplanes tereljensis]|uniref:Glycosyl transferase n=1 Tax=Paractinoplanes tereljensis TaxID=571912 RepID=A0A919NX19_9ACTN|nr:glycosyltransferase [Actinoplanes tereljensis]GIF26911.1 glycosyl transferase [Actinoplanes tereljensis]